jgi:hypothetical protein
MRSPRSRTPAQDRLSNPQERGALSGAGHGLLHSARITRIQAGLAGVPAVKLHPGCTITISAPEAALSPALDPRPDPAAPEPPAAGIPAPPDNRRLSQSLPSFRSRLALRARGRAGPGSCRYERRPNPETAKVEIVTDCREYPTRATEIRSPSSSQPTLL